MLGRRAGSYVTLPVCWQHYIPLWIHSTGRRIERRYARWMRNNLDPAALFAASQKSQQLKPPDFQSIRIVFFQMYLLIIVITYFLLYTKLHLNNKQLTYTLNTWWSTWSFVFLTMHMHTWNILNNLQQMNITNYEI